MKHIKLTTTPKTANCGPITAIFVGIIAQEGNEYARICDNLGTEGKENKIRGL